MLISSFLAPSPPPPADIMFTMDEREKAKKSGVDKISVTTLSEMWKALSDAEKQVCPLCGVVAAPASPLPRAALLP